LVAKPNSRRGANSIGSSIVLFVAVVWTFLPSMDNGFVDYDDSLFVTGNTQVQGGLTWHNVIWAFRNQVAANWHPLTTLSHMLDCQLYGLKPWGHHLTNVLLHAVNTVLLFLVFRRMTGACWRCAALAALFALHPLRVESVTWISERKDVLSTAFWLLAVWAYVRFVEERRAEGARAKRFYGLVLLFFSLGLMSKPMLVTLPFVLLLLDYWPLERNAECGMRNAEPGAGGTFRGWILPWRKLVWEKAPLFALAAVASAIAFAVQESARNIRTTSLLPLATRVGNALVSYCRYLGTLSWPVDLSPFYPYPAGWGVATVLLAGLALLGISVLVVALGRRRRYLPTGWFWFVGTLVPVIGLVQIGRQSMADHYTYIPTIGVLLALVWGAHELTARWRYQAVALSVVAVAAALACIGVTRQQIGHWKDDETLWRHALAVTKNNGLAHYNLGFALARKEVFDEAIRHYEEAIRIDPGRDDAHSGLAYALVRKHRFADAIKEYEEALRLNPGDAAAHNSLGSLLAGQGRLEEAIQHFNEALRLHPDFLEAHYDLGLALASRGNYREAAAQFPEVIRLNLDHVGARQKLDQMLAAQDKLEKATEPYREVLRSKPGDARAHGNLGRVLIDAGQLDEAIEQCTEAARLDPKNAEIQYHLGVALARKGEAEKAARQFGLVLELEPRFAAAHYGLGIIRQVQRRMPEALEHWREAARLAPEWPDPLTNLAWALATDPHPEMRDGPEAVKLATRAGGLSGTNNVRVLDTLAAAYAEAGRFAEASSTARQAQAAAAVQGQKDLGEQIQQRLALYGSNQPYRQDPGAK
jgi:tetratricopeptide (TPR) repeat protein